MTRASCDPKEPSDHAAIPAKRVSSTLSRIPLGTPLKVELSTLSLIPLGTPNVGARHVVAAYCAGAARRRRAGRHAASRG
jgi:hypothetical protein